MPGFASASEYEKYMRYLEGPRIVHPGTKGEGSKEEGQKGSSKKSEALLARRRAAQEGKTSKQDQKSQGRLVRFRGLISIKINKYQQTLDARMVT